MFSISSIIIAFFAGILGTLIGGTQTFICTGFIGLLVIILNICGINTTYLNDVVANTIFLPCIIFNGAGLATAYASTRHDIRGVETSRSLAFTNDPSVLLVGAFGGVLGYLIYALCNYIKLPVDTGAVSVIIVGIIGRILFNQENTYNKENLRFIKKADISYWIYQALIALAISFVIAIVVDYTKLYTIGFSISAMLLIFSLLDSNFIASHHTTLVTGYALMYTGNIIVSIIFGMIAHFISLIFGLVFNTDCGTHIDPPAIAIAICSFIIFTFM